MAVKTGLRKETKAYKTRFAPCFVWLLGSFFLFYGFLKLFDKEPTTFISFTQFRACSLIIPVFPGPDPWPRPGMQELISMHYTSEVSQLLYCFIVKSRQGRLICNA
jgi:hypothetical protein